MIRAECSCGWEFEREERAANLPVENNRGIAESVVGAHNFNHDWRDEEHEARVLPYNGGDGDV